MSDVVSEFSQKASDPKHCLQIKVYFSHLAIQCPPESPPGTFAASSPTNHPYAPVL